MKLLVKSVYKAVHANLLVQLFLLSWHRALMHFHPMGPSWHHAGSLGASMYSLDDVMEVSGDFFGVS